MTPKSSKHINIDELLGEFYENSVDAYHAFMGTYTDAVADETAPNRLIAEFRKQLYNLILDVIGIDEEKDRAYSADILKKEQRQKLTDLFKGDKE